MTDVLFWAKVDKGGECWLWTGHRHRQGYGLLNRRGKVLKAHRFAWELTRGPIPQGHCILHVCDNPPCCNPEHLRVGTQAENVADMVSKRRNKTVPMLGTANPGSRLTDEKVLEIRSSSLTGKELSVAMGVSPMTVSRVRNYQTWTHVTARTA